MSDQNIPTQEQNETITQSTQKPLFRGAAIHIKADGGFAVELVGITPIELYGALILVTEKVKTQLNKG